MFKEKIHISVGTAALIAGLMIFLPAAPYAEFYVFKKLLIHTSAEQTTINLINNSELFLSGIFAMLIMFIQDIILGWTMYIFFSPVSSQLSALAWSFRIVYTGLAIVAILYFLQAYQLTRSPYLAQENITIQTFEYIKMRAAAMNIAYILFGIYLIILGSLAYISTYVPKVIALCLILPGVAWIILSLKPYFFRNYDLSLLMFLAIGELAFPVWLLIKGRKLKNVHV